LAGQMDEEVAKDFSKAPVRWCGPMDLEWTGRVWKIATTRGIREVPVAATCTP